MAGKHTPVMQQHAAAKAAYPDAILFFRLGDFYEMFGDDAVLCARLLDLTLTSRNKGKVDEIPMAGVPHHAAHGYLARLLELGHKVAICEQMADPATVKGIVPRQVVRVLTPGLVTSGDHLESGNNNWLAALDVELGSVGIALLDLSTGELRAATVPDVAALIGELARAAPREVLVGGEPDAALAEAERAVRQLLHGVPVRVDRALGGPPGALLEGLAGDLEAEAPASRRAVGRVIRFAEECTPGCRLPVRRVARWDPSSTLRIDEVAQRHLELVTSGSGDRNATLLAVLDATETASGSRLLRRRLLAPLTDVARIRRRLDAVETFVVHARLRESLRAVLARVTDLERLTVRAAIGEASPRDLGAIRDGLRASREAALLLAQLEEPEQRAVLGLDGAVDAAEDVAAELDRALVERPPAQSKEGAIFRSEFDAELTELDGLRKTGTERIVELEARLRQETGLSKLRIRSTRVFGWYVEVTKSQIGLVPETWRRKQTVATGERYTLPELDDLAERIAHADERYRARELEKLSELVACVQAASERIAALARRIARWDVAAALADVAHRFDYCRPHVDEGWGLRLVEGRHPVVERLAAAGRFVPNDVDLDVAGERLVIITGPNMAGKSTLLRQVALCVIMAQLGSYVPARAARIGVIDRVSSRVGASDDLARGESTFMVEMRETAQILRSATRRSLVILDEIGRGTSTFDGLAIAWAVAEYLDDVVGCRALFATHYHELTALGSGSKHVVNRSVSAREQDGDIVFLHRLVPGAASRSYGVAVAKLAGLPSTVLARAKAVLESLEGDGTARSEPSAKRSRAKSTSENQLVLFTAESTVGPRDREVLSTLAALDVDGMTPLEALQLLARLKGLL